MENIRNFLESSTIHGLSYISTTGKHVRLFWLIVVTAGFIGAGIIIYESFNDWGESPVKTTIETFPISDITFPKVTVCPPRNTFTDLNHDLKLTMNMTLDNETRNALRNYSLMLLNDDLYGKIMTRLTVIHDKNLYFNWYHGFTEIVLPLEVDGRINYDVLSSAPSGNISTQHFGDKFVADHVHTDLQFSIDLFIPRISSRKINVTLHVDIEKISLKDLSGGYDKFDYDYKGDIDEDTTKMKRKYHLNLSYKRHILTRLRRSVSLEDVKRQKLDAMPGFRLNWYYIGLDRNLEVANYVNDGPTKSFVRSSIIINTLSYSKILI